MMRTILLAVLLVLLAISKPDESAMAKQILLSIGLNTMHSASLSNGTGAGSMIIGADDNLYGTTYDDGNGGGGTFYKLTATGNRQFPTTNYTVLHHFGNGSVTNDGLNCFGKIVQDGSGFMYGTCSFGGAANSGVVYRMEPSTGTVNILHSFNDGSVTDDGEVPLGGLVMDGAGNLYGTTSGGGTSWSGIIFKLSPTWGGTWSYSKLYDFTGLGGGSGGWYAQSLTMGSDGNLYGTTGAGGVNGEGMVFRYNLSTNTLANIAETPAGGSTIAGVTQIPTSFTNGGRLEFWGTTAFAGTAGYGVVYRIMETSVGSGTFNYDKIYEFNNGTNEGYWPWGEVVFSTTVQSADATGAIYGTLSNGGVSGSGSLFRIDYATLSFWEPTSDPHWSYGYPEGQPYVLVQGVVSSTNQVLFGNSSNAGANGFGSIWNVWLYW